jgi:hypothetical protein
MRLGIGLGIGRGGGSAAAVSPYPSAQTIAQRLTTPTSRYPLFICGSARTPITSSEVAFDVAATSLPIAGIGHNGGGYTSLGHVSVNVAKVTADTDATESATVPGVEVAWVRGHVEITYNGVAATGANTHARRALVSNPTSASYARLFGAIAGKAGGSSIIVWRHAAGISVGAGDGPRYYDLPDGKAACPASSYANDTTGSGYLQFTATVPVLAATGTNLEISCDLNEEVPDGQILVADSPIMWGNINGAVLINWSSTGASVQRWAKTTILSDAVFSDLVPLYGSDPMWLLEVWADGYGAAATLSRMQAAIARFRVADPLAPVIVHTGYPSSTSGASPAWVADVAAACAAIPGVLYLPTYAAMPDYATGSGLGYYASATVYNATGLAAFMAALDTLIVAAAA